MISSLNDTKASFFAVWTWANHFFKPQFAYQWKVLTSRQAPVDSSLLVSRITISIKELTR